MLSIPESSMPAGSRKAAKSQRKPQSVAAAGNSFHLVCSRVSIFILPCLPLFFATLRLCGNLPSGDLWT
jgi:hypothetical protein